MKLHHSILSKTTFDLLKNIQNSPHFKSFYLAGGTSLALQIGHRQSIDLDFFSPDNFKSNLIQFLPGKHDVRCLFDNSIELTIDDVKVSFMYFAYELCEKLINSEGIRLAHPIDIGLAKLFALQGRTTRKDIIDLYFIHKKVLPLSNLLELFENKYPRDSFSSYDSFRRLMDVERLQSQPMPIMIEKIGWDEILTTVESEIINHMRKLVLKN